MSETATVELGGEWASQAINGPVYLVDDDAAIADSLSYLLEGFGYQVRWFDSGDSFLAAVDLRHAGCVILDSRMPGLSGQQLQQCLNQASSPLAVIFLTGHGDVPMAVDAFKNGAFDFFQKPVAGQVLADALANGLDLSWRQQGKRYHQQRIATLTEREKEIFQLVVNGYTNKQMAETLFVAVRTIEVHRARVMKKLEANNMAELVKLAPLLLESTDLAPLGR
ncbi:response regulator transcription factor [Shewanella sp. NIFS-20-20]|uniref:response regulator transcription factor n=1 Tax=Shewanella sp. NIFS-20-20 TaxID=2853806 RepID=UPI001C45009D|nr:response regulator [Shewanella sp. NIFS-20-20]MBV7315745.1 response regulator [Shewanella sp. NIFS-20-20]